jgi:lipopolysaccharide/colanic/teichoic acid biosynthesis glycosyltransferase
MGPVFEPGELQEVVAREGVTDLVLCHRQPVPEVVARALSESALRGVSTPRLEEAYEEVTGKAAIFYFEDDEWLAGVRWVETNLYATKIKRALDVLVSLALLPLAVLIIAICAIAIKVDSPGPVFYTQRRIGLRGRRFTLVKLRTMIDSEEQEPRTGRDGLPEAKPRPDDPRITKVGRTLRAVSLDELPQLLLVLKGEMSLVGPRPEQPHLVERYQAEVPLYNQRHFVRPGLTGWAQVRQSYSESLDDVASKVQYDLYYISNLSMRLDVLILMKTIGVVILNPKRRTRRSRKPPEPPADRGPRQP